MSRLACFRNLHRGRRGVILCNGPSLNAMDLRFLRDELVIGLNKIHLGLERFDFHPRYLVVANPRVAEQSREALRAMSATRFMAGRAAAYLPEDGFTHHLASLEAPTVFSRDIRQGVREGGTVTHVALQIAWYMGFSEIIIIGMDHRFAFQGAPHEAHRLAGPDVNHFSPGYFTGHVWDNPDLPRSEASYRVARRIYETTGRRILDATVNGACRIFEKRDYRQVFGLT